MARQGQRALADAFTQWQEPGKSGWGLGWYLAAELVARYHESHGLLPHVIDHEGHGYYGIELGQMEVYPLPGGLTQIHPSRRAVDSSTGSITVPVRKSAGN